MVPASSTAGRMARPLGISYDTSCAAERMPPNRADQRAMLANIMMAPAMVAVLVTGTVLWDDDLGTSTCVPSLIRTDQTSANVVPGEVWLTFDWRNVPGESGEDARQKLQTLADQALKASREALGERLRDRAAVSVGGAGWDVHVGG